ncbi:MAG: hypothetical protein WCD47_03130 [Candidatus Sulfotelmatobacter sp.]
MEARFFKPWKGKKFSTTKLLILSESAYNWRDNGKLHTPSPRHPKTSLLWNIKNFGKVRYFTQMSRALCGSKSPAVEEMLTAWNEYAYTIYVQGTVGFGPRSRPTQRQFRDAGPHFLKLIEKIHPLKVIVTGKTLWNHMPPPSVNHRDRKAYTLSDGTLVWCLAIPHPANRITGFTWRRLGKRIRQFRSAKFPRRN